MTRVVVTGMGCVSAIGQGVDQAWDNVLNGRGGAARQTFPVDGEGVSTEAVVAAVTNDPLPALMAQFGRKPILAVDRFANLAAVATLEALGDAGVEPGQAVLERAAIVYGACSGGLVSIEAAYARMFLTGGGQPHPLTVPRLMSSAPASHLSILFGVRGLCLTVATACASSAHAIAEGMHLIRSGRADMVIVGGADASLTYGAMRSWGALQATSPSACRPFSKGRDGTILGEGGATLILESEVSASRRGARAHCYLAGAGASSDAAHMTQPNAKSAAAAVRAAHEDAGLPLDTGVLISAHGTGTALNDVTESWVLQDVYGAHLSQNRVIATKSAHGHMLGATGAMELILAVKALAHGLAPPILNYLELDPDCELPLVLAPEAITYRAAISASFGFGGLNSVLAVTLP
ncbi:beta-ketoacyl-[acyl-carrier-protein] synthase family protein [Phenylobacterium sp.]|uniref:beta-ketoacyl-[acyl-carrier-protein] synthase family protein n=1 Tax=Phenylobacterium sp. TaxID=1871053 RepID=UPI003BAB4E49